MTQRGVAMFSLREAAALIPGATVLGDDSVTFEHVSTDSRTAGPGDLFVALKGDRFDAHDFLPDVAARQIAAALVTRTPADWSLPALKVADTRAALGALARGWRRRFTMPLVAVTGSNGKTTVKEMIASIFAAAVGADARLATAGNFNNDIGLPLTLFRLSAAHQLAVVELGMNHPGETALLGKIAEPTVAVVNNAQREHQEFMATVEAVALEHASVIHSLSPEGVAVFPADDAYASIWRVAATGNRIIDFALNNDGRSTEAAVKGVFAGNLLSIDTPEGHLDVTLQVLGDHNAHNALAATAAALAAGRFARRHQARARIVRRGERASAGQARGARHARRRHRDRRHLQRESRFDARRDRRARLPSLAARAGDGRHGRSRR